ncbi:uncharacterized protein N7529_000946 [Penicillium soppii]|uniref:uncharacterized protein n=1 Tax=Penicillium soppii TaxID=69789 RepID=UPI0025470B4E|nr:uncharacterized protein N7529_000946 [Penicillium soppii]KAJ5882274.1 hypothetical protein N7529_000946 [Penicillium soppii]
MDFKHPEDDILPNQLDHILQNGVHTLNTERLPIYLEASRNFNASYLSDLQQEVVRLRQESAWHQELKEAFIGLFRDAREVYRLLQKALLKARVQHGGENPLSELVNNAQDAGFLLQQCLQRASHISSESESHLLEALGISLDDTNARDITLL